MLKAVIFDMDGVIIDSEPMHARAAILALEKYKVIITLDYLNQYIGSTTAHMCKKMIADFSINASPEELLSTNEEMKQLLLHKEGHTVVPYVIDLIKDLYSHGLQLMIASSSPMKAIEEVMEALNIKEYFTGYVSGMQVAQPKPAPDIFLKAVEMLQVKPAECIIIEDSSNGVNAAAAAGIVSIGFVNQNSGNQDLRKASILVEGFDEINYDFVKQIYHNAHLEPLTVITTERLMIRELSVDDAQQLYEIYQSHGITDYLEEAFDDLEEMKEKLKAYIQNVYHYYGFGLWGVFLKENDRLIGRCGIELKMMNGREAFELGYLLDTQFQGFGYGAECANAVISYAFTQLNAKAVLAIIDHRNLRSIHLAEKIGMYKTGEYLSNRRKCQIYEIKHNSDSIQF
ncbi:MAG: HAD-superfamily hydrolase, subfamily variant 3 [Herbinix sp.]|jgi:beta-phosphoglucomutase-like phosphatase (HAD superfamily)/RimJ/RimL family protein N-acetyltransferase|nr:HAD-superfamily hydrolase, subfamily variant 3 [Herbinix sp.]